MRQAGNAESSTNGPTLTDASVGSVVGIHWPAVLSMHEVSVLALLFQMEVSNHV